MAEMERLRVTNSHMALATTGTALSYEEKATGSKAEILYAISLVVVFLSLAALYESWAIPAAVLLVIPARNHWRSVRYASCVVLNNDVYFQVGVLTTMGLSVKNAISDRGGSRKRITNGGSASSRLRRKRARQRLRPILMTSLAFFLGVLPLAIASGAGSGGQNAIGHRRGRWNDHGHSAGDLPRTCVLRRGAASRGNRGGFRTTDVSGLPNPQVAGE